MSHSSIFTSKEYKFDDCWVEVQKNHCVTFRTTGPSGPPFEEVLFMLYFSDIGVDKNTTRDEIVDRATPLFKTMLDIHNRAAIAGKETGYVIAKEEIKSVLDNPKFSKRTK